MKLEKNKVYNFIPATERFKEKQPFKVVFRRKIKDHRIFNRIYEFAYCQNNMQDLSLSNVFYLNEAELIQISDKKQVKVYSIYKNEYRLHFYPCEIYANYIYNKYLFSDIKVELKQEIINY